MNVSRVKRSLPYECTERPLTNYSVALVESLPCYITAQLNASHIVNTGYTFLLGDGELYGGYENAHLEDKQSYTIYSGIMVTLDVWISLSFQFDTD